jgi:RNA polymerase sigma factor (sigma-70 family)
MQTAVAATGDRRPSANGVFVTTSTTPVGWDVLVDQIKAGQDAGLERLYALFHRGFRYYLVRQLGPRDMEDKIHDTFLLVVKAIQRGDLREPECLMGFVKTVLRRQVAAYIEQAVHTRRDLTDLEIGAYIADRVDNPEQQAIRRQRAELMRNALSALCERDRTILVRFYLQEHTQEQICREMSLTETQFRLSKSRAKAKFGAIGRKRLGNRPNLASSLDSEVILHSLPEQRSMKSQALLALPCEIQNLPVAPT